ncbi:hypothetical protein NDU88_000084, partial [Pleurodeles waltl]
VHPRSSQVTVPLFRHAGASRVFTGHSTTPQAHPRSSQITVPHHRSQYHSTRT